MQTTGLVVVACCQMQTDHKKVLLENKREFQQKQVICRCDTPYLLEFYSMWEVDREEDQDRKGLDKNPLTTVSVDCYIVLDRDIL